ncbi:glucosamine-6-phosphate deaminase, partial [Lactobacillus sp. UMNPBX16]
NGAKVVGLAAGSTTETLYQNRLKGDLNCENLTSINLDAYVGLTPDNPHSYHYFLQQPLCDNNPFKATYVPSGLANDFDAFFKEYAQIIKDHP